MMDYFLLALILFITAIFLFIWKVSKQTFDVAKIETDLTMNKFVYVDNEKNVIAKELDTKEICFVNPEDHNDQVCLTPTDIQVLKNMERENDSSIDYPFNASRLARSICIGEECINKPQLKQMTEFWPKRCHICI